MDLDEKLIGRYFARLCDETEEKRVRQWFATAEGQAYLSADMERRAMLWGDEKEGMVDHEIPTGVMFERIEKEIRRKEYRRWLYRAAAVVLPLMFTASLALLLFRSPEKETVSYREVTVARGEHLQVLMQDGTRIWLNADSRLVYPDNFNGRERVVKLEGEAYFEVAKNREKPFRVELEAMDILVTGTSFNIKAYPEDSLIQTCLAEGAIRLHDKVSVQENWVAMKPGEVASFSKNSGACRVDTTDDAGSYSAWKGDRLIFKKTPLREVLKVLERKFDRVFEVENPALYRYTYTITFHQESLREIMEDMQRITPVRFRPAGDRFIVCSRERKN
ncbi:MAG: FecR domain-containing protein [Oscillibacter sp.]|nr:FecR domain-containing protein [Oscillibacter sp.]